MGTNRCTGFAQPERATEVRAKGKDSHAAMLSGAEKGQEKTQHPFGGKLVFVVVVTNFRFWQGPTERFRRLPPVQMDGVR